MLEELWALCGPFRGAGVSVRVGTLWGKDCICHTTQSHCTFGPM